MFANTLAADSFVCKPWSGFCSILRYLMLLAYDHWRVNYALDGSVVWMNQCIGSLCFKLVCLPSKNNKTANNNKNVKCHRTQSPILCFLLCECGQNARFWWNKSDNKNVENDISGWIFLFVYFMIWIFCSLWYFQNCVISFMLLLLKKKKMIKFVIIKMFCNDQLPLISAMQ